jgi:hypothetical protein
VAAENCIFRSFTSSTDYRIFLDQMQSDEMDGSCSMYVGNGNTFSMYGRDRNCL